MTSCKVAKKITVVRRENVFKFNRVVKSKNQKENN